LVSASSFAFFFGERLSFLCAKSRAGNRIKRSSLMITGRLNYNKNPSGQEELEISLEISNLE
jgi:hypothetical protein